MNIKNSVKELVGKTPLLDVTLESSQAKVLAKLEMFNPAGSVKDRIALNMIEEAEKAGVLKPGSKIVEATSGNTGIGLASVGASKGYEVILVMPDTMTVERRKIMAAYGAQLVLTPGAQGMKGAIAKALEIQAEDASVFIPSQFENQANVMAHYKTTGPEILADTDGQVDIVVAGIGTGGTITGIGKYMKEHKPEVQFVAVEPATSAVLSGENPGKHSIQGIGAGFVPAILNTDVYDEIVKVSDDQAFEAAKAFAKQNGLLVGISSGAALSAAYEVASRKENQGKVIVVILPDNGDRYFSTRLFDYEG